MNNFESAFDKYLPLLANAFYKTLIKDGSHMRKKLVSLLSIGALSVGVLGACSNDEGSSESSSKDDVLKVWSFTDELKEPIKTYE